jgi:hypothetical protein
MDDRGKGGGGLSRSERALKNEEWDARILRGKWKEMAESDWRMMSSSCKGTAKDE